MIQNAALLLLWSAAAYRVWVTVRSPVALWRTSFTAAMVSVPVAVTVHFHRSQLDDVLGLTNVGGLLTHVVFAGGAASVNIYLETLQRDQPRRLVVWGHLLTGFAAAVSMIVTWAVAPIHQGEYSDLAPLAIYPAVALYHLVFYGYMIAALINIIRFCAVQTWTARHAAPARALSLVLIGAACICGLPVMILFLVNVGQPLLEHRWDGRLAALGNAILPWPLILLALGVLALLTVPWCAEVLTLRRHWATLSPLWHTLTQRHPEVHLPVSLPLLRIRERLRIREQRTVTEVHDALRRERVNLPARAGPEALGRALRRPRPLRGRGLAGSEVLRATDGQGEDVEQLLALARAYTSPRPIDQQTSLV